ncbi:MAG: T9SS type A sorting domain-containing protein, partial [Saprospiraceae bacterium]|nr:T9SS type A sorting domain-containing protein [Saprospiraceae bacterium]
MKSFLIIWIICLPGWVLAQPLISMDNFPQSGDTMYLLTDELPDRIYISPPGPNQEWNYNTLQAPFIEFETVEPASSGRYYDHFPNADLVVRSSKGAEKYLRILGTRLDMIGQGGKLSDDELALKGLMRWNGVLPDLVSDLKYEDDIDFNASSQVLLGRLDIPPAYASAMRGDPDSLRIDREVSRRITADAWGQILLPSGLFHVLRVRYVDEIHTHILTKTGNEWTDLTDRFPQELLGPPRMISYRFFSEGLSQQVAIVYTDEDENVTSVEYLAHRGQAEYYQKPKEGQWLYAYPNPAISVVRFKFLGITPGEYSIRFYNILGKTLFDRRYLINGSKTVQVDIGHLEKGTYL